MNDLVYYKNNETGQIGRVTFADDKTVAIQYDSAGQSISWDNLWKGYTRVEPSDEVVKLHADFYAKTGKKLQDYMNVGYTEVELIKRTMGGL